MSVAQFLQSAHPTAFSFEVLPPLRGKSIESVYRTIDRLMPFNPAYINITPHRTETIYHEVEGGMFERLNVRSRPGTVAIAAALKGRYGIPAVPHRPQTEVGHKGHVHRHVWQHTPGLARGVCGAFGILLVLRHIPQLRPSAPRFRPYAGQRDRTQHTE